MVGSGSSVIIYLQPAECVSPHPWRKSLRDSFTELPFLQNRVNWDLEDGKELKLMLFLININTSIRDLWTPKVSYTLWEGLESSKEENSLSVLQWIYHLMRLAMGISLDLLYNLKALHKTMLFLWKSTQLFLLSSPIMLVYSVILGGISVLFFFFLRIIPFLLMHHFGNFISWEDSFYL